MLDVLQLRHFEAIPQVDPGKIGRVIGMGAQSMVWSYGAPHEDKPQVIKAPLWQVRNGLYSMTIGRMIGQTADTARRELDLCDEYFSKHMVPTEVHRGADGKFCIVQDMVPMTEVTLQVFRDVSSVRDQLSEIIEGNHKMIAEQRKWLDAMGFNATKLLAFALRGEPYLDNVARDTQSGNLKLFDYGLFPMPDQAFFRSYYRVILAIQQANMAKFGLDFGGKA